MWAVVLAGGDGSRLREITTTAAGEVIPKRFCSLQRKTCLLEDAIKRAQAVAISQHICSVVAEQHRRWWSSALKPLLAQNIFVQQNNRGTAHGILLALRRSPPPRRVPKVARCLRTTAKELWKERDSLHQRWVSG
jgi:mannose-1-phosphate guanylyltransferase